MINQTSSTNSTDSKNNFKQFKVFPSEGICWFFSCARDYPNLTAGQVSQILCKAHCKVNDNPTTAKISTLNFSFGDFDESGYRDVYGYLNASKQFPVPVGATDKDKHEVVSELQAVLCDISADSVVQVKTEAERMTDVVGRYGK